MSYGEWYHDLWGIQASIRLARLCQLDSLAAMPPKAWNPRNVESILSTAGEILNWVDDHLFPIFFFWEVEDLEMLDHLLARVPIAVMGLDIFENGTYYDDVKHPMDRLSYLFETSEYMMEVESVDYYSRLVEEFGITTPVPNWKIAHWFRDNLETDETLQKHPDMWRGAMNNFAYWGHDTGHQFLDITMEEQHQGYNELEWDDETIQFIAEEWNEADAYLEEIKTFLDWADEERMPYVLGVIRRIIDEIMEGYDWNKDPWGCGRLRAAWEEQQAGLVDETDEDDDGEEENELEDDG